MLRFIFLALLVFGSVYGIAYAVDWARQHAQRRYTGILIVFLAITVAVLIASRLSP